MTEYDDAYALEQVKRRYGCNNPAGCLERGLHRDTYREAANSDGLTETQRNSPAAAAWAETARQREGLHSEQAGGIDRRPHSRACGITPHAHGRACSVDCPTCHGTETPEPEPFAEDPLKSHESTKRVLYHVVHAYQYWRKENFLPNELSDDAVRIGEQHLRLVDWFPEDEGWLAEKDEHFPWVEAKVSDDDVLGLIDEELRRLRAPISDEGETVIGWRKRKAWQDGVRAARYVATNALEQIRSAYVAEIYTRDTEAKRAYEIKETDGD